MNFSIRWPGTLSLKYTNKLQEFIEGDFLILLKTTVVYKNYISAPAGIYLLKVNNRNIRTRCGICSKLTIKTPEQRQWRRSGVFIVNFEHISHHVLVFQ